MAALCLAVMSKRRPVTAEIVDSVKVIESLLWEPGV